MAALDSPLNKAGLMQVSDEILNIFVIHFTLASSLSLCSLRFIFTQQRMC
jgi:hypothetical protein